MLRQIYNLEITSVYKRGVTRDILARGRRAPLSYIMVASRSARTLLRAIHAICIWDEIDPNQQTGDRGRVALRTIPVGFRS
jgi:hypothetical protein